MHVVLTGVDLGGMLVSSAACALRTSRGEINSQTRKPLHASDTGGYSYGCQLRMEFAYFGLDKWVME